MNDIFKIFCVILLSLINVPNWKEINYLKIINQSKNISIKLLITFYPIKVYIIFYVFYKNWAIIVPKPKSCGISIHKKNFAQSYGVMLFYLYKKNFKLWSIIKIKKIKNSTHYKVPTPNTKNQSKDHHDGTTCYGYNIV